MSTPLNTLRLIAYGAYSPHHHFLRGFEMFEIATTLDRARLAQGLRSDYKLALVAGISHASLTSYRKGKTLPDVRVISKLAQLTGEDPALMTAHVEFARAKNDEERTIWSDIAARLKMTTKTVQAGFSTLASLSMIVVVCGLLVIAQSHALQGLQALKEAIPRFILCEISSHSLRVSPYPFFARFYRWCSLLVLRAIGVPHA
jgi:transcriptional regulator with XRE-family HTH domain